jgi:uncharacterized protein YqeY
MLRDQITQDLTAAMRAKDRVRLGALRMIQAGVTEREKAGGGSISDDDVLAVITKQAKQRRDSIEQFERAGRADLAAHEADELAIIEAYLPAQASDDEIAAAVRAVVEQTGAASMKDMGRVMGGAMQALKGVADGARVQAAVRAALGA